MDIKLKSNRVTRDVPDLSDYTKISIPWDSSGNDKLYVYMKPDEHSQKVYIGSDENKGKERSKSLTFFYYQIWGKYWYPIQSYIKCNTRRSSLYL